MKRGGIGLIMLVVGGAFVADIVQKHWPVILGFALVATFLAVYVFVDSRMKAALLREDLERQRMQRERDLLAKYGEDTAGRILKSEIWLDQTAEQLVESRGQPNVIDQKFMKTKVREIWKYEPTRRGSYRVRITVENNRVVSWDNKI